MHWVAGFLFRNNGQEVALVSKMRPAWQAGKLNGIGGKIEGAETALEAMRREFEEEAGVLVQDWKKYALMKVQGGEVVFFVAHGDFTLRTATDEIVDWYPVPNLKELPVIKNLTWLIPLALDEGCKSTVTEYVESP